jgi:predicted N-acetyltransferase YhbS
VLISAMVKKVLRPAARVVRWFRREHLHVLAVTRNGASAFGMIGTSRWRSHFARIWFGSRDRFRVKYRFHAVRWVDQAHVMAEQHGLVVVSETPVPAEMLNAVLTVPVWVALSVDLRASEDEFMSAISSSARRDVQRLRSRTFTFDRTREPAWAGEFHRRYFLPSVVGRHGRDGIVMTSHDIATMVRQRDCEFVRVWEGRECVGAMMNERIGSQYAIRHIGWRDGDPSWPKIGVVGALYWHSMQRARLLGLRRVQLGGTPPYIEDGLFQFKSKWNAGLDVGEPDWGDHFLLLSPAHPAARRVLRERSFIVRSASNDFIVISGKHPDDVTMSTATARSIARWYRLRDEPADECDEDDLYLPPRLRAWFRAVPISSAH